MTNESRDRTGYVVVDFERGRASSGREVLPYIPKVIYRDIALPVDPHHATDLRARDLQVFNRFGTFYRRVVPGEFLRAYAVAPRAYVIVGFSNERWERHFGDRDGTYRPMGSTPIRPRRRATGRRRG